MKGVAGPGGGSERRSVSRAREGGVLLGGRALGRTELRIDRRGSGRQQLEDWTERHPDEQTLFRPRGTPEK
jgi:hypothetical protein